MSMTIDDVLVLLKQTQTELNQAGIDDLSKLRLDRLILDLRTQMVTIAFDPLKDISNMTVVDISKLRLLIPQLKQVINDEGKRAELVSRITDIAKGALKGVGFPIPS